MTTTTKRTPRGVELVRPKGGTQRHARRKGQPKVLCGIDSSAWKETLVEKGEPITCPWCEERLGV